MQSALIRILPTTDSNEMRFRALRRGAALFALLLALVTGVSSATAADAVVRHLSHDELIAKYADHDSRFADLDGVRVHYKDQGTGPALLLINGSGGDLGDWDGWVATVSPHYRMIRVDLPGFGLSGPIANGNYSVDRMLGLIDSLMDSLGEAHFAIAGNSYGGLVAFRYAATRVERVSGLILINAAGVEWGMKRGTSTVGRPNPLLSTPAITRSTIAEGLSKVINDPARITGDLIQRRLDFASAQGRDQEALAGIRFYERGDPLRVLAHIQAPVLIEWGGESKALSAETADVFASALKNARAVVKIIYPGGGHVLNIERPEATSSDAAAFLDRYVAPHDTGHDKRS